MFSEPTKILLKPKLLLKELEDHEVKVVGVVFFGSNANLNANNINFSKDYDLLIVIDKFQHVSEEIKLKIISSFLMKYTIRLDIHVYTLPELSSGLREPDLLLVGLSRNYKILYGTDEFKSIFQLIDSIEERNVYKIRI